MPMFAAIADAYRRTLKPKDIFWNKYVARPAAAVLLVPLERSRITPNQVTFASLAVFAAAAAVMIAMPGHAGLLAAVVLIELSYVLDCVDGQLARLRGTSTPVGAHLDFLMDELKAFLLVAAAGVRLWREHADELWLVTGLAGLVVVASAISLTTFVRRPEYLAAAGATAGPRGSGDYGTGFPTGEVPARSLVHRAVAAIESVGRFLIHYPSYLVIVALFNRLDLFLQVYLAVNGAYAARSLLGVVRKLGRTSP
jgi:phosphatidylglycerophosphate synthase